MNHLLNQNLAEIKLGASCLEQLDECIAHAAAQASKAALTDENIENPYSGMLADVWNATFDSNKESIAEFVCASRAYLANSPSMPPEAVYDGVNA